MSGAIYPSLKGRLVVVTGGGSGIGAGFTEAFARQGARVVFFDIAEADSKALEASLAELSPAPTFRQCDLMDVTALQTCLAEIADEHGPIDVLINNAANDDRHQIENVTPAYWDERIAVNLRHQYFCAQAVAPAMRARKSGVILNLGSISWHLAQANLSIYMTAKAGIEGLTRGLARDLGVDGIRVNCIIPGAVRTPRQERLWHTPEAEAVILQGQCLQLRVEPEDVAALALFLASDNAAKCAGREYYVDAGWYGA